MRGDRTATLRDCAGGVRRKWVRRAVAAGILLALAGLTWMLRQVDAPDRSIHPPLIRKVLNWIDPERQPPPVMLTGRIVSPQNQSSFSP